LTLDDGLVSNVENQPSELRDLWLQLSHKHFQRREVVAFAEAMEVKVEEMELVFLSKLAAKVLFVVLLGQTRLSLFFVLKQVNRMNLGVVLYHALHVLGE
jgi:hypothetical protein